jgi:hypothetical protein
MRGLDRRMGRKKCTREKYVFFYVHISNTAVPNISAGRVKIEKSSLF